MILRVGAAGTPNKQRIAAAMQDAVERFLSLDIRRVQDACNLRRDELLRDFASFRDDELLTTVSGLANTTAGRARQELTRPFQLVPAPQPIVINLHHDSHPLAPNAPAFVVPGNPRYTGVIFVLADNIDPVALCARDTRGSLVDVAFHEMLHLCGDAVKAEDGVARHQHVGTEVVRRLLGMPQLLP
jgi:hypothetical protein